MARSQRLLMLLDLIDTHDNLFGKHDHDMSNAIVRCQADHHSVGSVVHRGGSSISARAVESLCKEHQVIGVRVAGLTLMPLMMLCGFVTSVVGRVGMLVGSLVFVGMCVCSRWYWICMLLWLAVRGLYLAVMSVW